MDRQEEIEDGIDRIIRSSTWLYWFARVSRHFIVKNILRFLHENNVVIKVEGELPLISRGRAEFAIPETDCSGRKYTPSEWEDNVRYVLLGAEIQRDKDKFDSGLEKTEPLIREHRI